MQFKKAFFLIIFLSFLEVVGQECPNLVSPLNNATNVPVDTTIRWQAIEGVTGYIVSVGTTNGGTDIINAQANGSSNSIKPSLGLPENTRIYVTITLFFFNRPNITCESQSFTTENVTSVPTCTNLLFPLDGAININGAVNLRWAYASKATGYRITIGSTPGGTQFANNIDLGNTLTYNPPNDFPPDTTIYVKITPYNENGSAPNCQEESFSIGPVATLPGCTKLITPPNGATNVPLSPLIEWEPVPGATGYKVYIGKTPTENDILDGGSFSATSTFVFNFESNNQYFVRIIPFNAAGQALDCQQETFSTILGCGPFYDISNGELVSLNPEFEFPEEVGICSGSATTVEAGVEADGFRWYSVGQFNDVLISSQASITLNQPGTYLLEAYNFTENGAVECPTYKEFNVKESEIATIDRVNIQSTASGFNIRVNVSGLGNYEFSLDSPEGPYQSENIFNNAPPDTEILYVRDKNGCGIVEYQLQFQASLDGFPKFFTPNGDGYHDRWQYISKASDDFVLESISIFNRYGDIIARFTPNGPGWDGKVGGLPLPTSDYWYRAKTTDGRFFSGHFTLKR